MSEDTYKQDRRSDDGRLASLMDTMNTHHGTMVSLLNSNREHFDQRVNDLVSRFDKEVPDGHGVYHRKLIEEAARRQALQDAMRHKVLTWVLGAVLTALSAYAAGAWHQVVKVWHALSR